MSSGPKAESDDFPLAVFNPSKENRELHTSVLFHLILIVLYSVSRR